MPEKTLQEPQTRPEPDRRMLDQEQKDREHLRVYQSMRELRIKREDER